MQVSGITRVTVDLAHLTKKGVTVTVHAPQINTNEEAFVIPQIVPGTYMKINYRRRYHDIVFYDKAGRKMKHKRNDNIFIIKNASQLAYVQYRVTQSFGAGPLWDNIIPCAGTVFNKDGFLINFQLITGYFKSAERDPFEISFRHASELYASTSLTNLSRTDSLDVFTARDYAELIDRPVMYHRPDTASFTVGGTVFHIAVRSTQARNPAGTLRIHLEKIMRSMHEFMGGFSMREYYFMFYHVDAAKTSLRARIGLYGALEHRNSYVLTGSEWYDVNQMIARLNYFTAHEFFHTWAPLQIHSQKIDSFSFGRPDMSAHLWLYEGITDYLAQKFCEQYQFPFSGSMSGAIAFAEGRKERSFTESSRHIVKSNVFSWPGKMAQLANAYSRGQVVGFCLDLELLKQTGGRYGLRQLMIDLAKKYRYGKPFHEDSLFHIMSSLSGVNLLPFFQEYVTGTKLPPYREYMQLMGWKNIGKKETIASYGEFKLKYDAGKQVIHVLKAEKNSLGLQQHDRILYGTLYRRGYETLFWPERGDTLTLNITRDGKPMQVTGTAIHKQNNRYMVIRKSKHPTAQQQQYRHWYYEGKMNPRNGIIE